jgi:hypothetical protein
MLKEPGEAPLAEAHGLTGKTPEARNFVGVR